MGFFSRLLPRRRPAPETSAPLVEEPQVYRVSLEKLPLLVTGAAHLAKEEPLVRTRQVVHRSRLVPLGMVRDVGGREGSTQLNFADPLDGSIADLEDVIARSSEARRRLADLPIHAEWPEEALTSAYGLTGLVRQRGPAEMSPLADLRRAAAGTATTARVLMLVALLLDALHREGLVHGRIQVSSFDHTTQPPALLARELESLRSLGSPPYIRRPVLRSDARSGAGAIAAVPTLDADRHDLAQLVLAFLGDAALDRADLHTRALLRLLDRAQGRPGTAPSAAEWVVVLGRLCSASEVPV